MKGELATNLRRQMQKITQSKHSFYQLLTIRHNSTGPQIRRNNQAETVNKEQTRAAVFGTAQQRDEGVSRNPNRLAQFLSKRYDSQQQFLTYGGKPHQNSRVIDLKETTRNDYIILPKIKAALEDLKEDPNRPLKVPLKTNTERLSNRLYQNLDESLNLITD